MHVCEIPYRISGEENNLSLLNFVQSAIFTIWLKYKFLYQGFFLSTCFQLLKHYSIIFIWTKTENFASS